MLVILKMNVVINSLWTLQTPGSSWSTLNMKIKENRYLAKANNTYSYEWAKAHFN